jgi:hypothetical protein
MAKPNGGLVQETNAQYYAGILSFILAQVVFLALIMNILKLTVY